VCTILFVWQWRPDVPLVLAANRDERLNRETDPPMRLCDDPPVWGGRDRLAGGTWLAVDPRAGRVCAVTNRHVGEPDVARDPALRSRGELPVLLLTRGDEALAHLDADAYNPVNLLSFGRTQARWSNLRSTVELEPGVHALTVQDLDDPTSAKTVRLLERARYAADEAAGAVDLRDRLAALLTSHETDPDGPPQSAACIHGDEYGTVSSSTVVVGPDGVELRYADGRPCVTPYVRVALPEQGALPEQ
jgi:uncharacterized protein with NRDE domain